MNLKIVSTPISLFCHGLRGLKSQSRHFLVNNPCNPWLKNFPNAFRSRIKILYGIILLIILCIPGEAQVKNILPNGSFEIMDPDAVRERPDESWTFTTDYETVTGHVTQSRAIDRFRSYLIRAEAGRGFLTSDPFTIEGRERYILSYGICGDGMIETEVLWWREENDSLALIDNEYLTTSAVTDDWGIHHFSIMSPRRATAASVRFSVYSGQVWIDDVRFREDVLFR
jgi:hypothetical protein